MSQILCLIGGICIGVVIGAFLMAMAAISKDANDDYWGDKK